MRAASLIVASACLSSGCSLVIAQSGTDVMALESREQVHRKFGTPEMTGADEGKTFEEYQTRRKISEIHTPRVSGMGMGIVMTYGVGELFAFPNEAYRLARHTIKGQRLRVTYDANGKVSTAYLDGEYLGFQRPSESKPALPEIKTVPDSSISP